MTEVARISDQLQRALKGNAWHGPSVRELLTKVTAGEAGATPIPGVHSIWSLVLHMTAWQDVVRRRLAGEKVVNLPPEQDWPPVTDRSPRAWERALGHLEESTRALKAAIATLDECFLDETVAGEDYSAYVMLHGIVQHHLYHAGQIAVLKKAAPRPGSDEGHATQSETAQSPKAD